MKNKEKNVLQPHILTRYHEIDVLDRNGAIRKKQCFLWGPHVWHKITRWTFLCKTLLKNWNNNLISQKSGGAKAPPSPTLSAVPATTIKNVQEELNKVKKQAIDASYQAEKLAQYIRRDCLEISGVPPSESYSSNDIVRSVGELVGIQVTDGDISTTHALLFFKTDALPKIVLKFVRSLSKFVEVCSQVCSQQVLCKPQKACEEESMQSTVASSNVYISESMTSTRKKLSSEINKEKKRLKWKHIWTQNGRIFIKEADAERSFSFNSFNLNSLLNSERLTNIWKAYLLATC